MIIPEEVQKIVKEAEARNPTDPFKAMEEAMEEIKALPNYLTIAEVLIRQGVQTIVYRERHDRSKEIKASAGGYDTTPKVGRGSRSVNRVYETVYNYRINGTVLGLVRGEDLLGIARTQRAASDGYLFNAELCDWLATIVPNGMTVQDKVKRPKLEAKFRELKAKYSSGASSAAS